MQKSILDSIKGYDRGIIIDDSQIQYLAISWIDSSDERFEVTVENAIGGLVLHRQGLELYEMPDRLYYPLPSLIVASDGGTREAVYRMVSTKCTMRHQLRLNGTNQRSAYQASLLMSPSLSGLHKTHAIESGYPLKALSAWRPGR